MNVRIRNGIIRRDMTRILEIESESYQQPWGTCDFQDVLRLPTVRSLVSDFHGAPVGYLIYCVENHIRILNIATDPEYLRQGIGREMVKAMLAVPCVQSLRDVLIEVPETNLPAQLFWRAMGFRVVEINREHREESNEDFYVFRLRKKIAEDAAHSV